MNFLLKLAGVISVCGFMACTVAALYLTLIDSFSAAIGFGLMGCIWFGLVIVFGYASSKRG